MKANKKNTFFVTMNIYHLVGNNIENMIGFQINKEGRQRKPAQVLAQIIYLFINATVAVYGRAAAQATIDAVIESMKTMEIKDNEKIH